MEFFRSKLLNFKCSVFTTITLLASHSSSIHVHVVSCYIKVSGCRCNQLYPSFNAKQSCYCYLLLAFVSLNSFLGNVSVTVVGG